LIRNRKKIESLFEIIKTKDGSFSLKSKKFKENYHSTFGALNESLHVFIRNGLDLLLYKQSIKILEVGFGTGLNALLAFIWAEKHKIKTSYLGVEKFPVNTDITSKLNYCNMLNCNKNIFLSLHKAKWDNEIELSNYFTFRKINGDINNFGTSENFDIIFFDAFSPETQPEMWSEDVFKKMFDVLNNKGILTTYSSKGIVKQNLRNCGFSVKRLKGPEGKRHMLNAFALKNG
jgi:tRNA U34 5-methylaminomethyl-2-thiouridine-forming methyltransferase MnmC